MNMRRSEYAAPEAEAIALLESAPAVHIASTTAAGYPVLRAVHTTWVDGRLAFHGAPAGEKLEIIGRAAVANYDEIVAEIPSYVRDPERACPATTFYRSVQLHGRIEPIEDPELRARALQGLMRRFQPEGGHVPIDPRHPQWDRLYRKPVAGLLIAALVPERVTGKFKLGQNLGPDILATVLHGIWRRGDVGVDRAIELCRRHHPARPRLPFLQGPAGTELCVRPSDADIPTLVELLRGQYWNAEVDDDRIAQAHRRSAAWVGARDGDGRLVASARAISDGSHRAMIFDVIVNPSWRGRGVGLAVVSLLLDHPQLRRCTKVGLGTRDAAAFYRKLGFVEQPGDSTTMVRFGGEAAPRERTSLGELTS